MVVVVVMGGGGVEKSTGQSIKRYTEEGVNHSRHVQTERDTEREREKERG